MSEDTALIEAIEVYYDAAPRTAAQTEQVGPFTLFVGSGSWGYYARPALHLASDISADDVDALRARQRELDVAQEIEWQPAVTPSLEEACVAAGMRVHRFRLMVHSGSLPPRQPGVHLAGPDDDLAAWVSVQQQGFGGPAEADGASVKHVAARVAAGTSRMAAAVAEGRPISVGIHQPVGDVSEVVGVATLPDARRQGWASAVTHALVADAMALGVRTIFLSAADDAVARVYQRVGFRDAGEVCAAEPSEPAPSRAPPVEDMRSEAVPRGQGGVLEVGSIVALHPEPFHQCPRAPVAAGCERHHLAQTDLRGES